MEAPNTQARDHELLRAVRGSPRALQWVPPSTGNRPKKAKALLREEATSSALPRSCHARA
eukprot:12748614-Alexandrium_andersonii.AAC.1